MLSQPLVSVGIPCYNRPEGLRRTLLDITGQTYRNLEIVISNNCSPDPDVEKIAREFAVHDTRIRYCRQPENRGPVFNFAFVLEQATAEYFMWASDDDEWDPAFIEECIKMHIETPEIGMAFSNIGVIDTYRRPYREVGPFLPFAGLHSFKTIYRYLMQPELFGKANLVYSLFKRKLILEAYHLGFDLKNGDAFGFDVCINLAVMARSGMRICDKTLFKKRLISSVHNVNKVDYHDIDFQKRFIYLHPIPKDYFYNLLVAVKGTRYYWLTFFVMGFRILEAKYIYHYRRIKETLFHTGH